MGNDRDEGILCVKEMSTKHNDFGNRTMNTHLLTELHRQTWAYIKYCLPFVSSVPDEHVACKPHVRFPEPVLCHTKFGSKVIWEQGRVIGIIYGYEIISSESWRFCEEMK